MVSVFIKTVIMSLYLLMVLYMGNLSFVIGLSYTPTIVIFITIAEVIISYFDISWIGDKMKDLRFYQCYMVMKDGTILKGIRSTDTSLKRFEERILFQCKSILVNAGFSEDEIKKIIAEEVPESTLKKYNLNNQKDYKKFLEFKEEVSEILH